LEATRHPVPHVGSADLRGRDGADYPRAVAVIALSAEVGGNIERDLLAYQVRSVRA